MYELGAWPGLLHPVDGGLAGVGRAVVDDPEHSLRRGVWFGGHHLLDEFGEGHDPGLRGDPAQDAGVVDVVGGEVGEGSAAGVLELDAAGASGAGWPVGVAASQRLELGFFICADHVLVLAEIVAAPGPGVEVEDAGSLGREVRVAGEDPGSVLPGLDGIVGQPAPHRGGTDRVHDPAGDGLGCQLGTGPARQRHLGLRGQLTGHRLDLGGLHVGEHLWASRAGQISQALEPMVGEAATPLADRVDMGPQRGRDHRVGVAAGSGPHDPRPQQVTSFGTGRADPGPQDRPVGRRQHDPNSGRRRVRSSRNSSNDW